jgi:hypothetical protein
MLKTQQGDVTIEGVLHLDGALEIRARKGASVVVNHLKVTNSGWAIKPATADEQKSDEMVKMRGYKVEKKDTAVYVFDQPGTYEIDV